MAEIKRICIRLGGEKEEALGYENYLKSSPGRAILAERTIKDYAWVIRRLIRRKKELSRDMIVEYLQKSRRLPCRAALVYFLKYKERGDLAETLPMIPQKEPAPRQIPTYEEFMAAIKFLDPEERMIALFLLYTGVRCHEAFKILEKDIKPGGIITFTTKGGHIRTITLPSSFYAELRNYIDKEIGILPTETIFYPYSKASLRTKLVKFYKKLNESSKRHAGKKIGTHDFRRFFACYLYEASGHNIQLVKEALGHRNIETTSIYLQYGIKEKMQEKVKEVMNGLDSRRGRPQTDTE